MKSLRSVVVFLGVAFVVFGTSRIASAGVIVYAETFQGILGQIDVTTGVYTPTSSSLLSSGPGAQDSPPFMSVLSWDGRILYGLADIAPGFASLFKIDTLTGDFSLVESMPIPGAPTSRVIGGSRCGQMGGFVGPCITVGGVLVNSQAFGVITDPYLVPLTSLPFQSDGLVADDPVKGVTYYGEHTGTGSDELWRLANGTFTDMGSLGVEINTGLFADGILYGQSNNRIYSYAIGDSSITSLGSVEISGLLPGDRITALANAVPEPSSIITGGLGLLGVGLAAIRRRRGVNAG